ncbi:hypothetical protein [Saccharomonospora viridis]|uniref:Uncharacterized protein n=1 Tax=Saccharomonospora viridis (strain ATCC 15386 / DSM 43017 / JCM 3036 / CCUG 5913 / NBRC 12207 / NCIMB 9602 / P101) TaxID=471857 RepID=C7MV41_SACVD|nr:hypothetical protein [Saccharomonospora viridis]ACU96993.1 hypothetical protein Svir_19750 [Saccharomonospora viridis DSM 43017]
MADSRPTPAEFGALQELATFPLTEAIFGRRSRRFALGDEIPDGPLAYRSRHEPVPLTELERMLVLSAMGGTTGWHYSITRNAHYAPHVANYAGGAAGRTFPSAAGFHTAELFFTDDSGVYFFPTRDAGALVDPATEQITPQLMVERHRQRLRRLSTERLFLPAEEPYLEGHNTWCVNVPGSLLVIPVADIAQHLLAVLCFLTQNGYAIYDDIHNRALPGLDQFRGLVDVEEPFPLTFSEQYALTEATAELATSCYAGVLLLQAMGLGGWMFDGIDRFSILGASDNPDVPGLGFRYDTDEHWATPNPTGREGVFEAYCPPHYRTMADAVDAFAHRKFGPGGPFHPDTPGAWTDTPGFRSSAQVHDETFKACVSLQAQYILDTFRKFPATVPTVFILNYVQAHHLDLDFYDRFFTPGAYLHTHATHMDTWHRREEPPHHP